MFIVLLTRAYSALGRALAMVRSASSETSEIEFLLWGLGVMLLVHIVNWLGIIYFPTKFVFNLVYATGRHFIYFSKLY